MNVNRIRILYVKIYKMINNLNRSFMKKKFALKEMEKPTREQYKSNLEISEYNQVTFGSKRLCVFWAHII